jgi:cysteinyl-tRNA synthetase
MSETVQKDLGLTADQLAKLNALVKIARERSREIATELRESFPPGTYSQEEAEVREQALREFLDKSKRESNEIATKVLGILTPSQTERLQQIRLQTSLAAALSKPEIVKALGITKQQTDRIQAICDRGADTMLNELNAIMKLEGVERGKKLIEFQEKSENASAENRKAILALLTAEQRAKFERLVGKHIEPKWSHDSLDPAEVDSFLPN